MILENIKIRNKVLIIISFLLLLMVVISLTSYIGLKELMKNNNNILKNAYDIEDAGDLQVKMADLVMPVNDYLITGDYSLTSNEFQKNLKSVAESINNISRKKKLSNNERQMLENIKSRINKIENYAENIFGIKELQINTKGATLMEEMDEVAVEAVNTAEGFHDLIKTRMNNSSSESRKAGSAVLTAVFVLSGLSIIFGIALGLIIGNSINKPLRIVIDKLRDISEGEGDLTSRIIINSTDEMGELSGLFNKFVSNIHDLVAQVLGASQNLGEAVQQIVAGNESLSQRTTEQASSLEEISTTIEETSVAISQTADNSEDARKTSIAATNLTIEGNTTVKSAVESINMINETSNKISSIISVINEIAFQTNLLALNAAVEAARAGEQGRGFAVVATEVRNLAQRSGNAAKEIETLINDSVDKVEKGTELVKKSGDSLDGILNSIKEVSGLIAEIAGSSSEQKTAMDQITRAISELDEMTQSNAALVEETASASEEMGVQAKELLNMISNFKIKDSFLNGNIEINHS